MPETNPDLTNFADWVKFLGKLQLVLFKKQEAVRRAQFDGWAAVLQMAKQMGQAVGLEKLDVRKDVANDWFRDVQNEYRHWKDDTSYLSDMAVSFAKRILRDSGYKSDNPIDNRTMAKKMLASDFIDFLKNPNVIAEAQLSGAPVFDYAVVLYAQARLETGNFTSNKYNQDGNMFGMKASQKRKKIYVDSYVKPDGTWPQYRDQAQSFADRVNWDVYNRIQYINFIQYVTQVQGNNDNGLTYAEDPEYIAKWYAVLVSVCEENGMLVPFVDGKDAGLIRFKNGSGQVVPGADNTETTGGFFFGENFLSWPVIAGIVALLSIGAYFLFKRN